MLPKLSILIVYLHKYYIYYNSHYHLSRTCFVEGSVQQIFHVLLLIFTTSPKIGVISFHGWELWGSEKWSPSFNFTQQRQNKPSIQHQVFMLTPPLCLFLLRENDVENYVNHIWSTQTFKIQLYKHQSLGFIRSLFN